MQQQKGIKSPKNQDFTKNIKAAYNQPKVGNKHDIYKLKHQNKKD